MAQKEFVFLYPILQIINIEIENHGWSHEGGSKKFRINWAIFDDCSVSKVIKIQSSDRIIKVGLDFKNHIAKEIYPDQNYILSQLNGVQIIKIAGFHMWDCVEKLAKRAYEI